MQRVLIIPLYISFFLGCSSWTAQEWKDRAVYQVMIDRFAKTDGDTSPCPDLTNYCGGTFKGIEKNLDYIQGMGFNAIWITPVQTNIPGGYHGYWYSNFYGINENFGTEQDFKDLVKACHDRDIYVMVDVVANHIGYVQREKIDRPELNDYSQSIPFNDVSHFHTPIGQCSELEKKYPGEQIYMEICWLNWLPDLNQSHPFVRNTLLEWISWFVKTYEIDGLRLDAVRHVPKDFWAEFSQTAGVFTMGESFLFDISVNAAYLKNSMDSMLNFPLNAKLYFTFVKNESMKGFADYYEEAFRIWPDITVLGNFLDNHDVPRFLNNSYDPPAFKAALGFSMVSIGIPMVYYGDEQSFTGGPDPQNREPLWTTNMSTETEIYQFLRTLNAFRKRTQLHKLDQVQRDYDDLFYSFTRGEYFFAFTNSHEIQTRMIKNHKYPDGTLLCNLFEPKECVQVEGGKFIITLINKEFKILEPKGSDKIQSENIKLFKVLETGIANSLGAFSSL